MGCQDRPRRLRPRYACRRTATSVSYVARQAAQEHSIYGWILGFRGSGARCTVVQSTQRFGFVPQTCRLLIADGLQLTKPRVCGVLLPNPKP